MSLIKLKYIGAAVKLLTKGLECDEGGDQKSALKHYEEGKAILETARALKSIKRDDQQEEENKIKERINQHLSLVNERIDTINRNDKERNKTKKQESSTQSLSISSPSISSSSQTKPSKGTNVVTRTSTTTTPRTSTPTTTTPRTTTPRKSITATTTTTTAPPVHPYLKRKGTTQLDEQSSQKRQIKGVDPEFQKRIMEEILDTSPGVTWDEIAGLESAKQSIHEIIILPQLRPDLFTGILSPPKGVLLYGPPGTGKTMLAKAIASESQMTFFNISASSLTSKWVGDGEKMVRALFAIAKQKQPSVIFIDEIDSILGSRKDNEHDAVRRLKTEFLIQFDGVGSQNEDKILVIGATNLPWSIDEAARRRFIKRIYIPLPDDKARKSMIINLLKDIKLSLESSHWKKLIHLTKDYSGSDIKGFCAEAAMGPVRELGKKLIDTSKESLRPLNFKDFENALGIIKPSVSQNDLQKFDEWSQSFGTRGD